MGGMFGGSGTTANTFVYLLWATLRQPNLVKRLRKELQEAFPQGKHRISDAAVSTFLAYSGRLDRRDTDLRLDLCKITVPASRYQ